MTGRERITEPPGCRLDAAPYLLGALPPAEERTFMAHMEHCAVCRDEVAALAPVLEALPASAPAYPVPRALRRRVLRAVRREPRAKPHAAARPRRPRPRVSLVPGWLALPAAVAAAAVVVLLGGGHPRARVISASVGQAQLRVTNGHGDLIVRNLAPLPADRTYEVWLQSGGRTPAPSTLFAVSSRGRADVGVSGDLHGVSRVLVTVEPRVGSLVPTTRAVIQVPLASVQRS